MMEINTYFQLIRTNTINNYARKNNLLLFYRRKQKYDTFCFVVALYERARNIQRLLFYEDAAQPFTLPMSNVTGEEDGEHE